MDSLSYGWTQTSIISIQKIYMDFLGYTEWDPLYLPDSFNRREIDTSNKVFLDTQNEILSIIIFYLICTWDTLGHNIFCDTTMHLCEQLKFFDQKEILVQFIYKKSLTFLSWNFTELNLWKQLLTFHRIFYS